MDNRDTILMDDVPPDPMSPDDENNKRPPELGGQGAAKSAACTKGVAMSFGFKRRPATAPAIASNASAARRLANADVANGNDTDTEPLTQNAVPTGRTTPRLAPPKKEPNATKQVSRFGFRHGPVNRLNKVADLNNQPVTAEFGNNNGVVVGGGTTKRSPGVAKSVGLADSNRNRTAKSGINVQPQIGRFTLQSNQLPRPEPIRLIETKTAKTLANNSRKVAMYQQAEETSSKDGSLTEDSGVGSHLSGYMGDNERVQELERLESSPMLKRRLGNQKPRHLEVVATSKNTFDVRDLSDSSESVAPIPKLPSAFNNTDNNRGSYQNNGLVRERTLEYQRHIDHDNRRKISITSSEGFSDDYGEEEKTYKDSYRSEKQFIKPTLQPTPPKSFLKSRPSIKEINDLKGDSSPPSSDDQEWVHGGEAMADEISFSMSSSDESKDKVPSTVLSASSSVSNSIALGSAIQSLLMSSSSSFPKQEPQNVTPLNFDDSKFALVAANTGGPLLDDETLVSPDDSLFSCSDTEELIKRKLQRSSSNSKDINEKLTPPSPGTPTNASNSLSLSDTKDDFLIDDEIADQPALVFEDTIAVAHNDTLSITMSQNNSENTLTMVDSTPKARRRGVPGYEGSPLMKNKKFLHSRTGSLDTLSPCESIASDDLMMDYEYSQSSGLDDDRQSSGFPSLTEQSIQQELDFEREDSIRNWKTLIGNYMSEKPSKTNATRTRLLRSRASTPSSVPESPRSLEGGRGAAGATNRSRSLATSTPVKPRLTSHHLSSSTAGYDSDDSVRLDRANHTAMKQDIIGIKTMLLKLRRVLNETEEDLLLRSDTHNPFESQAVLTNGLFNSLAAATSTDDGNSRCDDDGDDARTELAELRRQVLFLQGQLEDKDRAVQDLQEQMVKLATENYHANSAPASTIATDTCNAATQTDRIRPISAGPSLLNGSSLDENNGSLVSANESRRSRPPIQGDSSASKRTPSRLRSRVNGTATNSPAPKGGEAPSPHRYASNSSLTSIPRRANSRTRAPPNLT
ncbi:uncharacterized protein LOC109597056 isoform X3 [Aethina tumida]|uniref:uncharacterized protein LOC109597056 isoform X3 n=1 Tax=Aethina tumida TaxID=116153 RepID=UPI00214954F2|nr:uncharacterized protein LOC109597056 isoform X3 [Aethina tumida]